MTRCSGLYTEPCIITGCDQRGISHNCELPGNPGKKVRLSSVCFSCHNMIHGVGLA